jgi:hypothetical protein
MSRAETLTKSERLRSERGYRHPRTGEKRRNHVPLRIDRLSPEVREAIIAARSAGKTWAQTAADASSKAGERLAPATVQRWYDLRVAQPETNAPVAASLRKIVRLLEQILVAVRA